MVVRCRVMLSFDDDVVTSFQTSLGNDAFSIAAKSSQSQQSVAYFIYAEITACSLVLAATGLAKNQGRRLLHDRYDHVR